MEEKKNTVVVNWDQFKIRENEISNFNGDPKNEKRNFDQRMDLSNISRIALIIRADSEAEGFVDIDHIKLIPTTDNN